MNNMGYCNNTQGISPEFARYMGLSDGASGFAPYAAEAGESRFETFLMCALILAALEEAERAPEARE